MQLTDPTAPVPRRFRRTAFGLVGVVVVASGIAAGGDAAFAVTSATDTTFSGLQQDFAAGLDDITVGANISQTDGTLTLAPATGTTGHTTLHLGGKSLTVQAIELASDFDGDGTTTGSNLTIVGGGTLTVLQTDSSLPAIEVSSGSSLTVSSGTIVASVPSDSETAAIGGGPSAATGPQNAGGLIFNGTANVTATGGRFGAAIGGGYGGSASIDIDDSASVTGSVSGGAAAVGAGYGSGTFDVSLLHDASLTAHQNGTGSTGAGVGGGASPTSQTSGSVTLGDEARITATSTGAGAGIGGGYHGDGGSVSATGYASISATGAQAAIGDGEHATGGGTSVTLSGQGVVVTAHGGTGSAGGAGIGGASTAYGNDRLTVDGGATLTASSDRGPGIGGLGNTVGMSVTFGNATVAASGGSGGAAIGAGSDASVGAGLSIGAGATVTVSSGSTSAIGGSTAAKYGSFSNSGTLVIPNGAGIAIPRDATASNDGTISNSGSISAIGTFNNNGSIVNSGGSVTGAISGNNFRVQYDAQIGTGSTTQYVFAPTLTAGGFDVPVAAPPSTGVFTFWNTSTDGTDGTNGNLTRTASLSTLAGGGSSDGSVKTLKVYALYQLNPVLPGSGKLAQGVVGKPYSASVAATTGTAPITYDVSGVPAGLSFSGGAIAGTPTTAGTFTVHVAAANGAGAASGTYTIEVVPTPITLSVPAAAPGASRYVAGSKASLTISNLQANETYTVKIGGKTAATGKASSNRPFTLKVTIPKSIGDGTQTVSVSGGEHATAATAKILTAAVSKSLGLKLSAKKVKHGKKIVVTVSKLYAGESVRVVFKGKHGKTAVGKATAKGAYVVTLKKGLSKGKYTVAVTGAGTSRKASAKLTVS